MIKFGSLWKIDKKDNSIKKVGRCEIRDIPFMTQEKHDCIYQKHGNIYTCIICGGMFVVTPYLISNTNLQTLGNFKFAK